MSRPSSIIHLTVTAWEGVTSHPHRFGGTEYRLGLRELGHVHSDALVDIPFPMKIRNELIAGGRAEKHHVLPESGWVSFYIRNAVDVEEAVALLRMSYEIASANMVRRAREQDPRSIAPTEKPT